MAYYHVSDYDAACQLLEFRDGKWLVEFTKPNGEVEVVRVDDKQIKNINYCLQEGSY